MVSLSGMLWAGYSGVVASQAAVSTAGHNNANVDTDGYSRQRVVVTSSLPMVTPNGVYGTGSDVASVERIHDDVLERNIRQEGSSRSYYDTLSKNLDSMQLRFNGMEEGTGLYDSLKEYFSAWSTLQATPPDNTAAGITNRSNVVNKAQQLSSNIKDSSAYLRSVSRDSENRIQANLGVINQMFDQLGAINDQILTAEANGDNTANDYRDSRDSILQKLSEYGTISENQSPTTGVSTVLFNGNVAVSGHNVTHFSLQTKGDNVSVMSEPVSNDGEPLDVTSTFLNGSMAAEINTINVKVKDMIDGLDNLSKTLIYETNRVHALGKSAEPVTQMVSAYSSAQPDMEFNSRINKYGSLPFTFDKGSFKMLVQDSAGKEEAYVVDVDPNKDTLLSVVSKINSAADGISAEVDATGHLAIYAQAGSSFSFSEDNSGFLAAAGLNNFFKGESSSDIAVGDAIVIDPRAITTGTSGKIGDNSRAKDMIALSEKTLPGLKFEGNPMTLGGFYQALSVSLANDKNKTDVIYSGKDTVYQGLVQRRESLSGVNISEEAFNLVSFQKYFEANSRFINVVDQMLDKVVNGLGAS